MNIAGHAAGDRAGLKSAATTPASHSWLPDSPSSLTDNHTAALRPKEKLSPVLNTDWAGLPLALQGRALPGPSSCWQGGF